MDLSTTYMGLSLKNPVVPSASPLARDLDAVRQAEDAGVAAITMYSLFEEQIRYEAEQLDYFLDVGKDRYAESTDDYPEAAYDTYHTGVDAYLEQLQKIKAAVAVPVVASLNGCTPGGWTDYARGIEQAGADALEINLYFLPTDLGLTGEAIERRYIEVLTAVKAATRIPVAMKLGPYFSSMANMAARLDEAGADALVLFNRFYQPVLDVQSLDVRPHLALSTEQESQLPVRWVAILFGRIRAAMAVTSGIHDVEGVVRAIMAGADVANICSAVLAGGPEKISELVQGLNDWGDAHGYESAGRMRGLLSQKSCPDPAAFERANYMKALGNYR